METKWYVVVGSGISGSPHRDADAAWKSFDRWARHAYGYEPSQAETGRAAAAARLLVANSRAAARAADISDYGRAQPA